MNAAPSMDQSVLLTYEAAAERLAINVWALRRLVYRRVLPVVSIGHRTKRVRPADLERVAKRLGGGAA
jgi:hypothetical protein